jgi:hypothetical protein
MCAILDACSLDDVANVHIVRACHLAALAVETHLEGFLVEEIIALEPVALPVGASLLGTRI